MKTQELLLLKCLQTSDRSEQGFSMIEVLISVLVTILFLAGTLQLMGVSTLYKVLAKQEANANLWIQSDIEEIQSLASNANTFNSTTYNFIAADLCNPTTINDLTNSSSYTGLHNSYATALREQIERSTTLPGSANKALLPTRAAKLYQMNRGFVVEADKPNALVINYSIIDVNSANSTDKDMNKKSTIVESSTMITIPAAFSCN
jgi:Tfp pilus assembly protein PilV